MGERVGLILVHGIGEQRRFEHLDDQMRGLIDALRDQYRGEVTVEIQTADADPNLGRQQSWHGGAKPSLKIFVRPKGAGLIEINVHEVWWADVNETYSLAKRIRFWLWGLSIWWFPAKFASSHELARSRMVTVEPTACAHRLERAHLFWVSSFFLSCSATIGIVFGALQRLIGFQTPDIVKVSSTI